VKIYLARHAETNYNVQKLCNADPSVDVHLTDRGVEQAESLSKRLLDSDFEVVFISELPRTRQTAEIVNRLHSRQLIVDSRLNDNRTGYEGKPESDWLAAVDASEDKWTAKYNDGESLGAANARAVGFMRDLERQPYNSVLIVTHGFITKAILSYVENRTIDEASDFQLPKGTYVEFEIIKKI